MIMIWTLFCKILILEYSIHEFFHDSGLIWLIAAQYAAATTHFYGCVLPRQNYKQQDNSDARDLPPTGSDANTPFPI